MQPDALSEANKKVARQRLKTLYLAGGIILAGLVLIVAMKYLGSAVSEAPPVSMQQAIPIKQDRVDDGKARQQFMQALKDYETNLEDQLALTGISVWNPETQQHIQTLKQQVLTAFSQADYQTALKLLDDLRRLVVHTLDDWEKRYSTAFNNALTFFNQMSADRAKLNIDEALTLKPTNADALALQRRIDVLPEVKQLLDQANIARIENDIRKRHKLLQAVTRLDPLRVELQDEISHLQQSITEEDFIAFINAGMRAVDQGRLAAARSALRNARAIYPGRRETRILAGRVSSLASKLSLSHALQKGDDAARRDDWSFALITYQQALVQHPDNGELINKIKLARRIVSLSQTISDYVDRHQRLSSVKVAAMAEKKLHEAAGFTAKSKTLASKSSELESLLERYNQPADLIIRSDGNTHIAIRGIGKVGAVTQKAVRLRPGKYTLEGKRPGYKSVLFDIDIGLNQQRLEVEVICHERI